MKEEDRKVCVGQFVGAHGVRGLVKLRSFTKNPDSLFAYDSLTEEKGDRVFKISKKSMVGDLFLVSVEGITDKESADQLRGDKLYIPRTFLPKPQDGEYYEADIVGLKAIDKDGKEYGKILGLFDYGAGPFLEIGTTKKDSFMLPFTSVFVPTIDLVDEKAVIFVPEGWL